MIISLTDKDTRRLQSILKLSEEVLVLACNNEVIFLVEINNMFKALSFSVPTPEELFIKLSSDTLQCVLLGEGCLVINLEDTGVITGFAKTQKDIDNNYFKVMSSSIVKVFKKKDVSEYLDLIESSRTKELSILNIDNLKDLIKSCALTECGLIINKGYAFSLNEEVIVYTNIKDPTLRVGFTISALKEIDKFKTQGTVTTSILNYLILRRDNFILGLIKANNKNSLTDIVPEDYMDDSKALATYFVDMSFLDNLALLNKKAIKNAGESKIEIDLAKGLACSSLDTKHLVYQIGRKLVSNNIGNLGEQKLYIPLQTLDKMRSLVSGEKNINIAVYPTNTRLKIHNKNISIIIRSEFK